MVHIMKVADYWLEDDTPSINIAGKWLKEFGFDIGKRIVIEASKDQIVIKAANSVE
jgi:hypothetical protein